MRLVGSNSDGWALGEGDKKAETIWKLIEDNMDRTRKGARGGKNAIPLKYPAQNELFAAAPCPPGTVLSDADKAEVADTIEKEVSEAHSDLWAVYTENEPASSKVPGPIGPLVVSNKILRASPGWELQGGADGEVGAA